MTNPTVALRFAFLPLLCLAGCLGPPPMTVIRSYEDMTTDYERTKQLWIISDPFVQYKMLSISGQLVMPEVGFVYYLKPRHGAQAAVGMSNDTTFYVTFTIDDTHVTSDVLEIVRSKVVDAHLLAVKAMLKKAAVLKAEGELADCATQLKSARAKDSDLIGRFYDAAEDKFNKVSREYDSTRIEFDMKYAELIGSIKEPGIFVYRWATESKVRGKTVWGPLFEAAGASEARYNGFAILGGLRVSKLYVGRDFQSTWSYLMTKGVFKSRVGTPTHILQTKRLLYVSDMDIQTEITAKLKASAQQLANASETLKKLDSVEMEYYSKKIQNLSNVAEFGPMEKKVSEVFWSGGKPDDLKKIQDCLDGTEGWQPVYTVYTELRSLTKLFDN